MSEPQRNEVAERVFRQAVSGIDDRLQPEREQRAARLRAEIGTDFAHNRIVGEVSSGMAHVMLARSRASRRRAEYALIVLIAHWREQVERLAPSRVQDYDRLIGQALRLAPGRPATERDAA